MADTPAEPSSPIDPVVRRIVVHCDADHAFRTFTDDLAAWWPVAEHSIHPDRLATVTVDGRAGGLVVEHSTDGTEHPWAEVLAWEPPHRLVLAWHPGRERPMATEVEVTFTAERAGLTRVELEHRGWERLGDQALDVRAGYDAGWLPVLNRFKGAADDPAVHRAFGIELNNAVWAALARTDRTADDDQRMVDAAHASLWHWARAGTDVNRQRGEWLCSHVYAVLGRGEAAVLHARRAMALTEAAGLDGFDRFYAHEGMARALACAGDGEAAAAARAEARASLDGVPDPEDRAICEADLAAGPWYGIDH